MQQHWLVLSVVQVPPTMEQLPKPRRHGCSLRCTELQGRVPPALFSCAASASPSCPHSLLAALMPSSGPGMQTLSERRHISSHSFLPRSFQASWKPQKDSCRTQTKVQLQEVSGLCLTACCFDAGCAGSHRGDLSAVQLE